MSDSPCLKFVIDYYQHGRYKPAGKTDKGRRWYPSDTEKVSCCSSVREPSRKWPFSIYKHCCTRKHIRQRLLEQPSELERQALSMTLEDALLHVNDTGLLLHVAKKLLGE
jgi:hypothetical protein